MYTWMRAPKPFQPFSYADTTLGADVCIIAFPNSPYSQLHVNSLNHKILLPLPYPSLIPVLYPPRFQSWGKALSYFLTPFVSCRLPWIPFLSPPTDYRFSIYVPIWCRYGSRAQFSVLSEPKWNGARSRDIVHKLLCPALCSIVLSCMMHY